MVEERQETRGWRRRYTKEGRRKEEVDGMRRRWEGGSEGKEEEDEGKEDE